MRYTKHYSKLASWLKENNLTPFFTFTNPKIDDMMAKDTISNNYIKMMLDLNPCFLVSSDSLVTHLKGYGIKPENIFFEEKQMSPEMFATKIDSEYGLLVKKENNKNFDLLKKITNPERIIFEAHSPCLDDCPYEKDCLENVTQYHMKECPGILRCPFNCIETNYYITSHKRKSFISYNDAMELYLPLGINTFILGNLNTLKENNIESIVDFLVKPEHRNDIRFELNLNHSFSELVEESVNKMKHTKKGDSDLEQ